MCKEDHYAVVCTVSTLPIPLSANSAIAAIFLNSLGLSSFCKTNTLWEFPLVGTVTQFSVPYLPVPLTCSMFSTVHHHSFLFFYYTCSMFSTANHHRFSLLYLYLFYVLDSKKSQLSVLYLYLFHLLDTNHHSFLFFSYTCFMFSTASQHEKVQIWD